MKKKSNFYYIFNSGLNSQEWDNFYIFELLDLYCGIKIRHTEKRPRQPRITHTTHYSGGRSLFSCQRILPLVRFRFTEKGPTGIVTSKSFEVVLYWLPLKCSLLTNLNNSSKVVSSKPAKVSTLYFHRAFWFILQQSLKVYDTQTVRIRSIRMNVLLPKTRSVRMSL